jgi:hypothetical protein
MAQRKNVEDEGAHSGNCLMFFVLTGMLSMMPCSSVECSGVAAMTVA